MVSPALILLFPEVRSVLLAQDEGTLLLRHKGSSALFGLGLTRLSHVSY